MNRKGFGWFLHSFFALLLTLFVLWVLYSIGVDLSIKTLLFALLIGYIYGLLPDLDEKRSVIHGWLIDLGLLIALVSVFISKEIAVIALVCLLFMRTLRHRRFVHSIIAALIFSAPLALLHWVYALVGFLAYLLHLIMDGTLKLK
ncbi:MAG: metal-dependent hydrolase [Candidatus Woesearchaeota archaeon]|nr:MAG: metal-dependent hydrolase [Candidatus Woesearchaeota archaeon]